MDTHDRGEMPQHTKHVLLHRLCPAGKRRRWDMIQSHGSVGIIIYHTEQQAFLMVRQFRPAVSITALIFTANHMLCLSASYGLNSWDSCPDMRSCTP